MQSYVKGVDPKEQEEAVARLGVVGTCQGGMLVGTLEGKVVVSRGRQALEASH